MWQIHCAALYIDHTWWYQVVDMIFFTQVDSYSAFYDNTGEEGAMILLIANSVISPSSPVLSSWWYDPINFFTQVDSYSAFYDNTFAQYLQNIWQHFAQYLQTIWQHFCKIFANYLTTFWTTSYPRLTPTQPSLTITLKNICKIFDNNFEQYLHNICTIFAKYLTTILNNILPQVDSYSAFYDNTFAQYLQNILQQLWTIFEKYLTTILHNICKIFDNNFEQHPNSGWLLLSLLWQHGWGGCRQHWIGRAD